MKKTYQKPRVCIEKFVLSQNVALSCGYTDEEFIGRPEHTEKNSCGWNNGFGRVYWLEKPTCGFEVDENFDTGEVCYNNPNGGVTIFAS